MGILSTAVLALALVESVIEAAVLDARQDTKTAKYCDSTQRNVCYSESSATTSGTIFRIAIPEVAKAPFDTLVQVVAPVSVGWAGIAWGGSMSQNPLTVVWMNGNQGVVSSRWATGHTPPAAYTGASYSVLSSTKDASHWTVNFLCSGCSTWATASLDPNAVNKIGYATSSKAPDTPASNTSSIGIHTEKGSFSHDLGMGKVDSNAFRRFVLFLSSPATSPSPLPSPSSSASSVVPVNPPTQRTSSTRIPTTIIHASPTNPDAGPVATRPSTTSAVNNPPTTVGRTTTSSSVRTIITTVSRPTTVRTTSSRPVTVTVTVTQPPAGTTTRARPTATTSCYRRVGRPYRYCTSNPNEGDDDDDEGDDSYDGWNYRAAI